MRNGSKWVFGPFVFLVSGFLTSSPAMAATASVNGANIPALSQIVDASSNVWTLSSGVVYENGAKAGFSDGVILLLEFNGKIYQENTGKGFWYWSGSTWVGSSDPRVVSASGANI